MHMGGAYLPPVPELGDLDLSVVRQSRCFANVSRSRGPRQVPLLLEKDVVRERLELWAMAHSREGQ